MRGMRKLALSTAALVVATVGLFTGHLDGATWSTVIAAALASFSVGNGLEHVGSGMGRRERGPSP